MSGPAGGDKAVKPYWQDGDVALHLGDCRDVLARLPAESVSCCMTSPPFFGLRKYICEPGIWGGDPDCPHTLDPERVEGESYAGRKRWQHDGVSRQEMPEAWVKERKDYGKPHLNIGFNERWGNSPGQRFQEIACSAGVVDAATCSLCGAWRGWLGLEPTVEMYVAHTIEWLRAVRRVMRKDGVLWLDIDDSRSATGTGKRESWRRGRAAVNADRGPLEIPAKNLCLIPQRIAIAAQEDGWIVRSEITITSWMPESAKDRPTDAARKVLMLVKQKAYWYDGQAVRVEAARPYREDGQRIQGDTSYQEQRGRLGVFTDGTYSNEGSSDGLRNLGSVWDDIPPAAYPDAHFATFAVEEPERCILASCPAEICVKCGKARRRVAKKGRTLPNDGSRDPLPEGERRLAVHRDAARAQGGEHDNPFTVAETQGWTDCGCGAGFEPGTVLDPFVGTGTTCIAARKLGRRCIGIDASEEYLQQAVTRLTVGDSGIRRMVEARRAGAEQGVLWEGEHDA